MKKIKSKIYEILNDKVFWIFLGITLVFFALYIKVNYANDTYAVLVNSTKVNAIHFVTAGRLVTAIATVLVKMLHLSFNVTYLLSFVTAIITLTASQYIFYNIIRKYIKSNKFAVLLSIVTLLNIFVIELFMYIEKGIMVGSILFSVLSFMWLNKYFEKNKKNKKYLIYILISMFLANSSYQGTVGLFVVLAMLVIIKYSKNIKQFLLNNILVAVLYGVPAIANYLVVKIFSNARMTGDISLRENLSIIFKSLENTIGKTYGIMQKNLFLYLIIFVVSLFLILLLKNRKIKVKEKGLNIFFIVYILFGTFVATMAPQMIQNTSSIWIVVRSTYPFASILGILIITMCMQIKVDRIIKVLISIVLIIFLLMQLSSFVKITIDHYTLNYKDKEVTDNVNNLILEYEQKTGNIITQIAVYQDEFISYTYKDLFLSGDINVKAFVHEWSLEKILEYYLVREFDIIEQDEEIKNQFKEINWDYFNDNQIIFDGNIMHLCVF